MNNSLLIFVTLLFLSFTGKILGYDWSSENITVIESEKSELKSKGITQTTEKLKDREGNIFSIVSSMPLEAQTVTKILELNKIFFQWENISIRSLKYVPSEGGIEIIIFPDKYTYNNIDFLPFIPGGMLFIQTDTLMYNFRMTKNKLLIRMKGKYSSEELLSFKISEAIRNPRAYIRKRDPEYFLTKLEQLENGLETLGNKHQALKEENNKLRYSVLILHNKGFFGAINLIDKKAIKRVLEIKTENPNITKEQIAKQMAEENSKISSTEIDLIFYTYYNKFK